MFSSNTSQVANGSILGVEDVFSAYLHRGNGNSLGNDIPNGIQFGGTPTNGTILHLTGDSLSDSAPVPCPFTSTGVGTSTSTKKYGTASLSYNGTSTNILTAASAALRFGTTADFTVECWVYNSSAGNQGVFHLGNDFGSGCVFVNMYPANQFQWGYDGSYTGGVGSFPSNTWIHVALVRQSGVLKLYVNGTKTGSDNTYAGNISLGRIWVGNYYDTNYAWNGFIDDFRVSNKAVYTANFTPPSAALAIDTIVTGSNYGGMVWAKNRTSIANHAIFDTLRGGSNTIRSNTTDANLSAGSIAFNTSGWCVNTTNAQFNGVNDNYVSWSFRRQAKFFDVVTWTGDGTNNRQISHALGSTPGCIIVKETNQTGSWYVYHRSAGTGNYLRLNATDAVTASAAYFPAVSSTTFTPTSDTQLNTSSVTYVAYLFAHDAGGFGLSGTDNVITCGSWTGSGANIDLGYEPQWLLVKKNNSAWPWYIVDNMRGLYADPTSATYLLANTSAAETTAINIKVTSTGFTQAITSTGETAYYIAIRRGPMKTPTSGTSVFTPATATGSGSAATITGGPTPTDFVMYLARDAGHSPMFLDRLRGSPFLNPASTSAESSPSNLYWDVMNGYRTDSNYGNYATSDVREFFKRAPGFMDVVCYTGTGSTRTVSHNLGVAPELMIVKTRNSADNDWAVYAAPLGATKHLRLNATIAEQTGSNRWGSTSPTASVFTVGDANETNWNTYNFVAYLFASCPGVSKVGSYTGTGGTQTISCGFAARFVLIKRTDSTGSWWVWDTARGMVAGTDPRLALQVANPEVNANWVYTDASGFQIVTTDATVNASGGSYIYLAIA